MTGRLLLGGTDPRSLTPGDMYSVIYALMAEEAGGVGALEEQLDKWQEEAEKQAYMTSPDRMAPDRKVPEPVAQEMKAVMQFAAPAPLKEKKSD